MTKQKSFLSILVVLSLFLLAGCSQTAGPADAGMKTYCAAYLHRDDDSIKKAELSKEELERDMLAGFTPVFQSSSNNLFNKEQATKFGQAFMDMLKKIQIETKMLGGDDQKARVEVKVNQFDMKDLDEAAIQNELKDKIPTFKTQEEAMDEVTNTTIRYMEKLEPKGEYVFTVDCTYDKNKKIWVPDDNAAFLKELLSAVIKK